ncbi:hypothetical protein F2Q69_00023017 [Brassica cretica]|uniref:Uncharacterized protein n=1 Tax=Brassica cretica TaxID=69181 RepID=A0A8S9QAN3_BRACR|nr:hypothetical protein F2Q69_00023017 [Brassica cretica]
MKTSRSFQLGHLPNWTSPARRMAELVACSIQLGGWPSWLFANSKLYLVIKDGLNLTVEKSPSIAKHLTRLCSSAPQKSMDQTEQSAPDIPVEVHSSDQTRQTNRAVYRLDPINLARANSDSDHGFSLLARLARTACTGVRADDLSTLFDPIMDFSFGYFSKPRILKLSEDLGSVGTQLVLSERPAALAERPAALVDRPAYVLILTTLDIDSVDASGQEPNDRLDQIHQRLDELQASQTHPRTGARRDRPRRNTRSDDEIQEEDA